MRDGLGALLVPRVTPSRRAFLSAALFSAAGVALGACSSPDPLTDATGRLRIATGNVGAVFDRYGRALASEVNQLRPQIHADTVNTAGSVSNVEAVVDGSAEVSFCLGDTAVLALDGLAPFDRPVDIVAVTRLYDSFLQVIVARDSPVRQLADLTGRRLVAGEPDSGTRITMTRCLERAGVDVSGVDLSALPLDESIDALRTGQVDALGFVSGFPIPALVSLGKQMPLRAVDIGAVVPDLIDAYGPQYVTGPLPMTAYGLAESVDTVSIKTYLIASAKLADPLVEGIASVIFDHQDDIQLRVPDVRQPTVAAAIFTQPIPLHPAAQEYFRQRERDRT